jgi:Protein of unknown function (DUF3089)
VQIRIKLFFSVAVTLSLACAGYGGRLLTEPNKTPQAAEAPVQVGESSKIPPNDYGAQGSWLCRPGVKGACNVDLTTTIVAANGALTREAWTGRTDAPIDCFYVYPTVSTDPTPNSDMNPDAAELNVIRQQFARFGSVCRLYAPMYRQVTLAGLRVMFAENRVILDRGLGYDDVKDAWRYYLEHDNNGRGFVLIGHSQGSFVLAELIRQEIDGKPVQSRLVSAILLGATVAVPRGKDVGGTFPHLPLCHSSAATGCVITYASFRSTIPPPPNTLFGKVAEPSMVAACTNPAALSGGEGQLHAYLDATGRTIASTQQPKPKPWVVPERPIETAWVSLPGLLTARCATNENATYLEVTVHGDPSDPRVTDITGDLMGGNQILANWGLHLIDVNLALGNLVDIVGQQAKAWEAKAKKTTEGGSVIGGNRGILTAKPAFLQ